MVLSNSSLDSGTFGFVGRQTVLELNVLTFTLSLAKIPAGTTRT